MQIVKNIAEYNNLIIYSFSKIFEIRLSEFTHQVEIILKSWNILIIFNSTICKESVDFKRTFAMNIIFIYYALYPMY